MTRACVYVLLLATLGAACVFSAAAEAAGGAVAGAPDFDLPPGVDVASFRDGRMRELEERMAAPPPSAGIDDEQAARFEELRAEHRRRLERLMDEGNVPRPDVPGDAGLPARRNLAAGDDTFENVDFDALRARHEEIMSAHRTTMENFRAEHAQFLAEHAERMKELRETLDRELPGGYNGEL